MQEGHDSAWSLPRRSNAARARSARPGRRQGHLNTPRVVRGHCPHPIASSCAISLKPRSDDPYGALAWPERRQCCDELEFAPDWPVRCELQVHHATLWKNATMWAEKRCHTPRVAARRLRSRCQRRDHRSNTPRTPPGRQTQAKHARIHGCHAHLGGPTDGKFR